MRRWVLLGIVVAVVTAIVAVLSTGLGRDPSVTSSPLVGKAAPDFTLAGLDGPAVTLSALRGQVVVVNFWASWCTECHEEQAALDTTWQRYRDSGVVVLGIDFQDTTAGARDYVHQKGLSYPVVQDSDSRTALAYGIRGIPETFLIDRTGQIVDRTIGLLNADALAGRIDGMLKAGAP
ncbi:MAG TPA: TlpA disulfide reductase family protein [Mycobacteriales bacterium]|nr:TlpA disulfide reductase family protein [Mycobacteriales bacterium]